MLYDTNDHDIKYEIESKTSLNHNPLKEFLYCDGINTLIYEYDAKLYQLNLSNVKHPNDLSQFQRMKCNVTNCPFSYQSRKERKYNWLNMTYLKRKNSIFAIHCNGVSGYRCSTGADRNIYKYTKKCAVLDLKQKEWIKCKGYPYKSTPIGTETFRCQLY